MIFGKSGLQGLPTRVALFPWAFSRQGATGFPLLTTWDPVAGLGRAPIPENISGRKLTQVLNSVGSVLVHHRYVTKRPRTGEGCDLGNSLDSGRGITARGGGSGYAALFKLIVGIGPPGVRFFHTGVRRRKYKLGQTNQILP